MVDFGLVCVWKSTSTMVVAEKHAESLVLEVVVFL